MKGPTPRAESDVQNAKQLVVVDFNKKCDEYFRELFSNIDIENREITEHLIVEYNFKVNNLLLEIQADYRFRLWCHDILYADMAVWTDMLKISLRRCSTPLAHKSNQTVTQALIFNPNPP